MNKAKNKITLEILIFCAEEACDKTADLSIYEFSGVELSLFFKKREEKKKH